MPELDLGIWKNDEGQTVVNRLAPKRLIATMIYPDKREKREEFLSAASHTNYPALGWDKRDPFARIASQYCDEKLYHTGYVAGHILLLVRQIAEHHKEFEASVNRAVHITERDLATMLDAGTFTFPVNADFIRKAWTSHKSVSHLWAASEWFLDKAVSKYGGSPMPVVALFCSAFMEQPKKIPIFLALAKDMQAFGVEHKTRSGRTTLSIDDLWLVPEHHAVDMPESALVLAPLLCSQLAVLERYKAPIRVV